MVIIQKGSTFLSEGAIVPDDVELDTMIHALIEGHDRVVRTGGTHYGRMDHHRMKAFISQLQNYKTQRGA